MLFEAKISIFSPLKYPPGNYCLFAENGENGNFSGTLPWLKCLSEEIDLECLKSI